MGYENAVYVLDKTRGFYNNAMSLTGNNEQNSKELTIFHVERIIQVLRDNSYEQDSDNVLDWEMALKSIDDICG